MASYIIALLGFSASGKDSVSRVLEKEFGYKFVVSATTRPIRSNEVDGYHYYFKTNEDFQKLIDYNKLIEYRSYNTIQNGKPSIWHYGIENSEIDDTRNNVVCVDYKGFQDFKQRFGERVISIFINVDEKSRRYRAIARDKNFELAEWNRRYEDDKTIFKDIHNSVDYFVNNYDFEECVGTIVNIINSKLN